MTDQQLLTQAARLAASAVKFAFNSVQGILSRFSIGITKVWFDVNLRSITAGAISVGIELIVFGSKQTISISLNLKNLSDTVTKLARKLLPSVFKQIEKIFG